MDWAEIRPTVRRACRACGGGCEYGAPAGFTSRITAISSRECGKSRMDLIDEDLLSRDLLQTVIRLYVSVEKTRPRPRLFCAKGLPARGLSLKSRQAVSARTTGQTAGNSISNRLLLATGLLSADMGKPPSANVRKVLYIDPWWLSAPAGTTPQGWF